MQYAIYRYYDTMIISYNNLHEDYTRHHKIFNKHC